MGWHMKSSCKKETNKWRKKVNKESKKWKMDWIFEECKPHQSRQLEEEGQESALHMPHISTIIGIPWLISHHLGSRRHSLRSSLSWSPHWISELQGQYCTNHRSNSNKFNKYAAKSTKCQPRTHSRPLQFFHHLNSSNLQFLLYFINLFCKICLRFSRSSPQNYFVQIVKWRESRRLKLFVMFLWCLATECHVLYLQLFRVQETQRLIAEPVEGVSATPYEDNLRYFNVAIAGPVGTPYEGKSLAMLRE